MNVDVEVTIDAPEQVVWQLVSDIEHAADTISGIEKIEVLERPDHGLSGLKWRETRTLFGKTAVETMWITEAEEGSHYLTEARSHGSVYRSRVYVEPQDGGTRLGMAFGAEPQSLLARLLSPLFGSMMKGATKKALLQDLEDVKAAAEARHRS